MSRQIAVRVPEDLLAKLDELVRSGADESRAAVRAGLGAIARILERRSIDHSIPEGYRRHPPSSAEDAAVNASLREAIQEEPW